MEPTLRLLHAVFTACGPSYVLVDCSGLFLLDMGHRGQPKWLIIASTLQTTDLSSLSQGISLCRGPPHSTSPPSVSHLSPYCFVLWSVQHFLSWKAMVLSHDPSFLVPCAPGQKS